MELSHHFTSAANRLNEGSSPWNWFMVMLHTNAQVSQFVRGETMWLLPMSCVRSHRQFGRLFFSFDRQFHFLTLKLIWVAIQL
jgi:hypothetical protein